MKPSPPAFNGLPPSASCQIKTHARPPPQARVSAFVLDMVSINFFNLMPRAGQPGGIIRTTHYIRNMSRERAQAWVFIFRCAGTRQPGEVGPSFRVATYIGRPTLHLCGTVCRRKRKRSLSAGWRPLVTTCINLGTRQPAATFSWRLIKERNADNKTSGSHYLVLGDNVGGPDHLIALYREHRGGLIQSTQLVQL